MQQFHDRINLLFDELLDKDSKITQKEFADLCGVTHFQVNNWINYRGVPDIEVLKTISQNLHVNPAWLIGLSEIRFNPADAISMHIKGLNADEVEDVKKYIDFLRFKKEPSGKEPKKKR